MKKLIEKIINKILEIDEKINSHDSNIWYAVGFATGLLIIYFCGR
jgi:hypothetical protein